MADPFTEADAKAIEELIEKYRRAVLDADWQAWGNTLAQDVFLSPAHEAPRVGRDSAVEWVRGFPPIEGFTVHIDEVDGAGSVAYARGKYQLVMKPPEGETIEDHGNWLQIHRRQPDGSWLYARMMFHSTVPTAA